MQDALPRELNAFEEDVSPQNCEEPTYEKDRNAEHDLLLPTDVSGTEIDEMIEAGVLCRVDEGIGRHPADMKTVVIPQVLSDSFHDLRDTYMIIVSIVDSALAKLI